MWVLLFISRLVFAASSLRCINFYGIETEHKAPVCDWKHEPRWYLQQLKDYYGLNSIRLPYSREYAIGNNFRELDNLINTCYDMDVKIILDYHRTYSTHQGAVPTEGITLGQFIDTHIGLLERYKEKIWGVSIFNEIQIKDGNYTNHINHMVVHAIESQFPNRYKYFLGCADWGHDCSEITIPLGFEDRSFVDIHQYAFTDDKTTRNSYFPEHIPTQNYFVGEIGALPQDVPWLRDYLKYLEQRKIFNLCFWTIAHSVDTGGLWKDDCETLEREKVDALVVFFKNKTS